MTVDLELHIAPLIAGFVILNVAMLAQVFYRQLSYAVFVAIEAVGFIPGIILIALGVTDDLWFSVIFGGMMSLVFLIVIAAIWRKLKRGPTLTGR